jgi:hypothetical protein
MESTSESTSGVLHRLVAAASFGTLRLPEVISVGHVGIRDQGPAVYGS